MIKCLTNCIECVHRTVCKYEGNANHVTNKLKGLTYGKGTNDDYDWNTMTNSLKVNIDISCPDFRKGCCG